MLYGLCHLSIVPLRFEASDKSELVSQLLYGDHFKVLEKRKNWSKIRIAFDTYEGWIDNKQYIEIEKDIYRALNDKSHKLSTDLINFVQDSDEQLQAIPLGASLEALNILNHRFDGDFSEGIKDKPNIIKTAFRFLNEPYLWGVKTHFGIDC